MKGISPFLAAVLLIAFTVAVGGIISLFMTRLTTTQTGEAERGAAGVAECAGVYIDILNVTTGTATGANILVRNPSKNVIYTLSVYDNAGNLNDTAAGVQKRITSGSLQTLVASNIPATGATKVTITGYCENSAGTANISITGTCPKGGTCWPS